MVIYYYLVSLLAFTDVCELTSFTSSEEYVPTENIVISDDSVIVPHDPNDIRPDEGVDIAVSATSNVIIDLDMTNVENSALEVYKVVITGNVAEVDIYYKVIYSMNMCNTIHLLSLANMLSVYGRSHTSVL